MALTAQLYYLTTTDEGVYTDPDTPNAVELYPSVETAKAIADVRDYLAKQSRAYCLWLRLPDNEYSLLSDESPVADLGDLAAYLLVYADGYVHVRIHVLDHAFYLDSFDSFHLDDILNYVRQTSAGVLTQCGAVEDVS